MASRPTANKRAPAVTVHRGPTVSRKAPMMMAEAEMVAAPEAAEEEGWGEAERRRRGCRRLRVTGYSKIIG